MDNEDINSEGAIEERESTNALGKLSKIKKIAFIIIFSVLLIGISVPLTLKVYNNYKQNESIKIVESKQTEYNTTIEELTSGIDELDNAGCIDRIKAIQEEINKLDNDSDSWKLYNGDTSEYFQQDKDKLSSTVAETQNKAIELYNTRVDDSTVDTTDLSEDDCNSYKDILSNLKDEIDGNKDLIFTDEDKYNKLCTKIDDSIKTYDDAIEAIKQKVAEEEAARQAVAQQAYYSDSINYSGNSSNGGSYDDDGVWRPSYYDDYWAEQGAADGSLTQWADGYYVAHNWSANGHKISSKPSQVYINGRLYNYVSSREVPRDTTYDGEFYDYVHQNDGIGFQTCVNGGGYLVNHYEPAD